MNRKASSYFWAVSVLFLLNSCSFKMVKGDKNIVTETISVSDFSEIDLSGGNMILNYTQSSDDPSVQVSTDKNIYDMYDFVVEGKTLKVKPKDIYKIVHFSPSEFIITANSSKLEELETAGSTEVNVNSILTSDKLEISKSGSGTVNLNDSVIVQDFSISMAGSGTLNAKKLYCGKLNSELAGSGELNLGGQTAKASFEIAGSGEIYAFDFVADEVHCDIAGSANIEVNANKLIKSSIAGSGTIRYKGNPQITTDGGNAASIKKVVD